MYHNSNENLVIKNYYTKLVTQNKDNEEGLTCLPSESFKNIVDSISNKEEVISLDMGYGYGQYSMWMANRGFYVDAVDIINKNILLKKLNSRIKNNIHVYEMNLNDFNIKKDYDFIFSKDVLHYLKKEKAMGIIEMASKHTKPKGVNYFIIFADINRKDRFENVKKIQGEANFACEELIEFIKDIYKEWNLEIKISDYAEKDKYNPNVNYFQAKKVQIIAKRTINNQKI